jgi:hypothetical protein
MKRKSNQSTLARKSRSGSDVPLSRHRREYIATCERLARVFGSGRAVEDLKAAEIQAIVAEASVQVKATILLGVCAGYRIVDAGHGYLGRVLRMYCEPSRSSTPRSSDRVGEQSPPPIAPAGSANARGRQPVDAPRDAGPDWDDPLRGYRIGPVFHQPVEVEFFLHVREKASRNVSCSI